MEVQKRENDLVLGTFGRGFYVLDDYSPLREVSAQALAAEAELFPLRRAWQYDVLNQQRAAWGNENTPNPPYGATFTYHVSPGFSGDLSLVITPAGDPSRVIRTLTVPNTPGLHRVTWDLRGMPPTPAAGAPPAGGGRGGGGGAGGCRCGSDRPGGCRSAGSSRWRPRRPRRRRAGRGTWTLHRAAGDGWSCCQADWQGTDFPSCAVAGKKLLTAPDQLTGQRSQVKGKLASDRGQGTGRAPHGGPPFHLLAYLLNLFLTSDLT